MNSLTNACVRALTLSKHSQIIKQNQDILMNCYITATGSFLPGQPITNNEIPIYMGELDDEANVRQKILRMNGIKTRHYALDKHQNPTHNLYELATKAVQNCLSTQSPKKKITYLSAGTTNAPLTGPGLSSRIHDYLSSEQLLNYPVEINSNSGICSASAQALINAARAVHSGEHKEALSIGVEQPSAILNSKIIDPPQDHNAHTDLKRSKWFMSVFLRTMLSDGAGAFHLSNQPNSSGLSFKINWTYSQSFANQTPICMQLESHNNRLSQDVDVLAKHMRPCVQQFLAAAFKKHQDQLSQYKYILPHLSSFFFKRFLINELRKHTNEDNTSYWTNLESRGNTGAASIYIILDEFTKSQAIKDSDKILLFIPESGQFNFAMVSLTAHKRDE